MLGKRRKLSQHNSDLKIEPPFQKRRKMNDNLDIELEQKKEVLEEGETLMALE